MKVNENEAVFYKDQFWKIPIQKLKRFSGKKEKKNNYKKVEEGKSCKLMFCEITKLLS